MKSPIRRNAAKLKAALRRLLTGDDQATMGLTIDEAFLAEAEANGVEVVQEDGKIYFYKTAKYEARSLRASFDTAAEMGWPTPFAYGFDPKLADDHPQNAEAIKLRVQESNASINEARFGYRPIKGMQSKPSGVFTPGAPG
jgi:hypothetical protein